LRSLCFGALIGPRNPIALFREIGVFYICPGAEKNDVLLVP